MRNDLRMTWLRGCGPSYAASKCEWSVIHLLEISIRFEFRWRQFARLDFEALNFL